MKVYILHSGCRYRGGEIENIYAYKKNAIAQGELLLERKIKSTKDRGRDNLGWNQWHEVAPEANVIKAWQSQIEEIIIYEYEVK